MRLSSAEHELCGLEQAVPLSEFTHLKNRSGTSLTALSQRGSNREWGRLLGDTDPLLPQIELPLPVQTPGPGGWAGTSSSLAPHTSDSK